MSLDQRRGVSWGSGCSRFTKFQQNFILAVHKTCKNNKLKKPRDAQNHFESACKRC